mgnify:CR=1 FL=1
MINVVIVEDNRIIREGLATLIDSTEGYACIGNFGSGEDFLAQLPGLSADVVLMDVGLPGKNGIDTLKEAKADTSANFLMLTVYEDNEVIFDALCAGACGYLVKKTPPSRLLEAIKEVFEGGSPMSSHIARKVITVFQKSPVAETESTDSALTTRERDVLALLGQGNNYQEIANSLFISIDTVRHHIRNIYKKLHVHTQSEAVAKAIRKGLI